MITGSDKPDRRRGKVARTEVSCPSLVLGLRKRCTPIHKADTIIPKAKRNGSYVQKELSRNDRSQVKRKDQIQKCHNTKRNLDPKWPPHATTNFVSRFILKTFPNLSKMQTVWSTSVSKDENKVRLEIAK